MSLSQPSQPTPSPAPPFLPPNLGLPVLNPEQQRDHLEAAERVLAQHLESYHLVGALLLTIKARGLHVPTGQSFEDYCATRWQIKVTPPQATSHPEGSTSPAAAYAAGLPVTRPLPEPPPAAPTAMVIP